jgi:carboxypeptidase Q
VRDDRRAARGRAPRVSGAQPVSRIPRRPRPSVAVCLAAAALAIAGCARGPAPSAPGGPATPSPGVAQVAARILVEPASIAFLMDEGAQRSRVADDLRHLTDVIGPRLTGSPAMRRANEWAAARLRAYGADSVALEAWPFGVTWERGPLTMRLLSPHERWLSAASWAWAPGTNGARAGDVVFMDATSRPDFDRRFAGRLRGAWVMLTAPYPRVNPEARVANDSVRVDSLRRLLRREKTADERAFLGTLTDLLAVQGVAGEIIDGGKDYGLFVMSGSPDAISPFPQVVVGNQNFAELHRLLAANERVRVEVTATNTLGRDTVMQWNTVGEIRGSDLPNEIVVIGAHLDSWDLGTGATDNGASSVAVLEAARLLGALKATGVRPRRTIRFVLFSGEEQGLYGSQYYVLRHAAEMPRLQAMLVLDNGSGRIVSVPLQGRDELYDLWRAMLRPLAPLGPLAVRIGSKGGTDHLPFLQARVPAFNYDQLPRGYDHTYHSQLDVFSHAVPEDVQQAAVVMAVNALQLANLDRLLARNR